MPVGLPISKWDAVKGLRVALSALGFTLQSCHNKLLELWLHGGEGQGGGGLHGGQT